MIRLANIFADRKGAAMVEFTLVAPLLVSLSLGLFEFGRALQHHHVINKGVRDAVRYLARVEATCSGSTGSFVDGADVVAAKNLAISGYPNGGTPILSYWTDPGTIQISVFCVDNTAETYRGKSEIPVVRATARVPYQDLGFFDALGLSAPTFTVTHEEMHIGE